MQWKDNRETNTTTFKELSVGEVFTGNDNITYIKINREEGFDICNNTTICFCKGDLVEVRNATLVLE